MLTDDAVLKVIPNTPDGLRVQAQRAFTHGEMRNACEQLTKSSNIFARLLVAEAFVELQIYRHRADYELTQVFDRIKVLGIIARANSAISAWNRVRNTPNANVFLTALLINSRWNR